MGEMAGSMVRLGFGLLLSASIATSVSAVGLGDQGGTGFLAWCAVLFVAGAVAGLSDEWIAVMFAPVAALAGMAINRRLSAVLPIREHRSG
jgi:hypothetical protein